MFRNFIQKFNQYFSFKLYFKNKNTFFFLIYPFIIKHTKSETNMKEKILKQAVIYVSKKFRNAEIKTD
jgi:hypothetical protein